MKIINYICFQSSAVLYALSTLTIPFSTYHIGRFRWGRGEVRGSTTNPRRIIRLYLCSMYFHGIKCWDLSGKMGPMPKNLDPLPRKCSCILRRMHIQSLSLNKQSSFFSYNVNTIFSHTCIKFMKQNWSRFLSRKSPVNLSSFFNA